MNNKYGLCCNCPPLMGSTREFTEWKSSRSDEVVAMKALGFTNVNDYRQHMIANADTIAKAKMDELVKANTCRSGKGNTFFIDSSKFNDFIQDISPLSISDIVGKSDEPEDTPVSLRGENMTLSNMSARNSKYVEYR
jgi:hypothetical protein